MKKQKINAQFPRKVADLMEAYAKGFNKSNPGTARWRFDENRFDAAESVYIAKNLEYTRQGLIEMAFPEFEWQELLPVDTKAHPADSQYKQMFEEPTGRPRVSKGVEGIIPMTNAKVTEAGQDFYSIVQGYYVTVGEAEAAIRGGYPLPTRRGVLTREHIEREIDEIAFVGTANRDDDVGIVGLLNLTASGIHTYTPAAKGTGASKNFEDKNPDDILLDLHGILDKIELTTLQVERADTLLLPLSTWQHIRDRRVGDGTSTSVLSYFKSNAEGVDVRKTARAETAGASSTKRMMAYRKDPNRIEFILPVRFRQHNPYNEGLSVVTVCEARTAGVAVHRPGSIAYGDDV